MSINIGISWTYTELHVVTIRNGQLEKSWTSSYPITNLEDFSDALFEVCNELDLKRGGRVSIAYESDVHTHEFLELPNMKKKDMQKYLQRRISSEKPFDEDAAWCYHEARHDKNTEGVLLHLMPKNIVDAMIRICDEFFFVAKRLVPLTEIYTSHISCLKLDDKEKLLLIALFDNRVQMVVASGSGEILFVRELAFSWDDDEGKRLLTDVDRTLRYAKQRTGGGVTRVIIMGDQSVQAKEILQNTINIPIVMDESSADCFFWAKKVSDLPITRENNFIPKLARSAITKRTGMRVSVMSVACLLLMTLSFSGWVEYKLSIENEPQEKIVSDIDGLQQQLSQLQDKLSAAKNNRKQLDKLVVTGLDLPVIFFNYLGNLTPKDMQLNSAEIFRETKIWRFHLTGKSSLEFTRIPELLTRWESGLSAEPWNATIDLGWKQTWLSQLHAGAAANDTETAFELGGVLR